MALAAALEEAVAEYVLEAVLMEVVAAAVGMLLVGDPWEERGPLG